MSSHNLSLQSEQVAISVEGTQILLEVSGAPGADGNANISDAIPQPTGVASAGVSEGASRADHVHALGEIALSDVTDLVAELSALGGAVDAAQAEIDAIQLALGGTATPTHVYLSGLNGNDANSGLSPAAAVATYARVWELLPMVVYSPFVVHVGAHTGSGYTYVLPPENRVFAEGAFIVLYGDGAGQAGEDGFTVVTSGALGASTANTVLQIATTPATDAYRGYTIELTNGPAAGHRRHIRSTAGDLVYPVQIFEDHVGLVTPVAGNTYRILRPAARMVLPDLGSLAGSTVAFHRTGLTRDSVPLHVVNLSMSAAFGANTYLLQPQSLDVQFYFGVECTGGLKHDTNGNLYAGVADGFRDNAQELPSFMAALGLTATLAWQGWGLALPEATGNNDVAIAAWVNGGGGRFTGYVVGGTVTASKGTTLLLLGGRANRLSAIGVGSTCALRVGSLRSSAVLGVPFLVSNSSGFLVQASNLGTIEIVFTQSSEATAILQLESTAVGSSTQALISVYAGGSIVGYPNMSINAPSWVGYGFHCYAFGAVNLFSGALTSINLPLGTAFFVEGTGSVYLQGFASAVIAALGLHVRGGSIAFRESRGAPITAGTGPAVRIENGGSVQYNGSATTWASAVANGGTVEVRLNGSLTQTEAAGALTITNTALGATAHGLKVSGGGRAYLRGGANTPINANGYGVDARFGGQVYFGSQPSSVVGATADLIVDSTVGGQPDTALAASESAIAFSTGGIGAFNGSLIARAA